MCLNLPHGPFIVGQWLFDWQTLVGGSLAFAAAWATVRAVRDQIGQTEAFHRDELKRRHNAARAIMPLALSEISEYCQSIAAALADEVEARDNGDGTDWVAELAPDGIAETLPPQHFPSSAIPALQPFIETLSDKKDIRHVAELIASLQILASRYSSFNLRDANVVDSLYGRILDAAKVRMLSHAMFNYARFLDDAPFGMVGVATIDGAWDSIHREAVGFVHVRRNQLFPHLKHIGERIGRYKQGKYSPWNEKFGN